MEEMPEGSSKFTVEDGAGSTFSGCFFSVK